MQKEKIFSRLEDLGFNLEQWENMDKTIEDIILEEKETMLCPSFFNTEYLGDICPQDKPKKFVYFTRAILFYEDSEFSSYEDYLIFLDKVSNIAQVIKNFSIPCVGIENNNDDFHFIGFLFVEE